MFTTRRPPAPPRKKAGGAVILSRNAEHLRPRGNRASPKKTGRPDENATAILQSAPPSPTATCRYASTPDSISTDKAQRELDATSDACREFLGDLIFGGRRPKTLAGVCRPSCSSRKKQNRPPTAESCTGGLLAKYLTDMSGSSAYFSNGWVDVFQRRQVRSPRRRSKSDRPVRRGSANRSSSAMANGRASSREIDLRPRHLRRRGVQREEPKAKPVGTVCIAPSLTPMARSPRTFNFPGDREMIRDRSAKDRAHDAAVSSSGQISTVLGLVRSSATTAACFPAETCFGRNRSESRLAGAFPTVITITLVKKDLQHIFRHSILPVLATKLVMEHLSAVAEGPMGYHASKIV